MVENTERHIILKLKKICTLHYLYDTSIIGFLLYNKENKCTLYFKVTVTSLMPKLPNEEKNLDIAKDNYSQGYRSSTKYSIPI